MSKKNISVFNLLKARSRKKDSMLIVDSNKQIIKISATNARITAEKALNNLSLLIEKNKETYKRSQILLTRANEMYNSEIQGGSVHAER